MKCNVNRTNRIIRFLIGIASLLLGLYFQSWWGLVGLLALYTISIAWCPKSLLCATLSEKWWHQCCQKCC